MTVNKVWLFSLILFKFKLILDSLQVPRKISEPVRVGAESGIVLKVEIT
jgi:hypothetical protein